MPNILVFVETVEGQPTDSSFELLAVGFLGDGQAHAPQMPHLGGGLRKAFAHGVDGGVV